MGPLDWGIVLLYVLFALATGVVLARRAGRDVDEYFLSGRTLPWWLAGTSMIATSFAADTPLLITGWVRDFGIWKNWAWWCFAVGGVLQVFLFARWWRRGGVMTKAELAELRYGGREARVLRGTLGVLHAGFTNTCVLAWVLLAAGKILDVLLGIDPAQGLVLAAAVALSYSLLAGFWGVVVTDAAQFAIAVAGGVALAWLSWRALGAVDGLREATASGTLAAEKLRFLPPVGPGGPLDASFWTAAAASVAVYLGVTWWASENVDGSSIAIQRIAASRDPRQGMLATLWFLVAHYALRPWLWIPVALASLVLLPALDVRAPEDGTVVAVDADAVVLAPASGDAPLRLALADGERADWSALPAVEAGDEVRRGDPLARADSERAYVVMMLRYLPAGLLGLVAASLLAAFMSTVDTHVNLASSFFVNDVYRRFMRPAATPRHYVLVARLATVAVLVLGGLLAAAADSIAALFLFFVRFLAGVGPVYVLRWLWWRVRASTEITAMLASAATAVGLEVWGGRLSLGALSPGGEPSPEGSLCVVVVVSSLSALVALALARRPDPRDLVPFYRRVRPLGWWGPVRALAPDVAPRAELGPALTGILGGLAATFGTMSAVGFLVLGRTGAAGVAGAAALAGGALVAWAVRRLEPPGPRAEERA